METRTLGCPDGVGAGRWLWPQTWVLEGPASQVFTENCSEELEGMDDVRQH